MIVELTQMLVVWISDAVKADLNFSHCRFSYYCKFNRFISD